VTLTRRFAAGLCAFLIFLPLVTLTPTYQKPQSLALVFHEGATFAEYPLPSGISAPWYVTNDSQDRIWFTTAGAEDKVGVLNPSRDAFSIYDVPAPNETLAGIAIDRFGNAWFTEELPYSYLGEIANGASEVTQHSIPSTSSTSCGPDGITPDSTGNVWFTCEFSSQIGEFFPASGTFAFYDLKVPYSTPYQIVFNQNQSRFYFSCADADMIGYGIVSELRNFTSDGLDEFAPASSTYSYPTIENGTSSLISPTGIALGSNGSVLWMTEHGASSFDSYNIGSGTLTKYFTSRPGYGYADSLPNSITFDGDNLWLAEHYGNKIAEFNPRSGSLTEYDIPCCKSGIAGTLFLTLGGNNTIWFSEYLGDAIGELIPTTQSGYVQVSSGSSPLTINSNSLANLSVLLVGVNAPSSNYTLGVSGISPSGDLSNTTLAAIPPVVDLSGNENASIALTLRTTNLKSGDYELTISAIGDNVTYSTIVALAVKGQANAGNDSLLLYAGITTAVICVLAVVFLYRRRSSSQALRKHISTDRP
jgi:streptogramin lyase